ncbi:MAG: hypothetical protein WDZ41_01065 [Candidatus Babeliales bacterium]
MQDYLLNYLKYFFFFSLFITHSTAYPQLPPLIGEALGERLGGRITTQKGAWILQNTLEYIKAGEEKELIWAAEFAYGLTKDIGVELFIPIFLKNAAAEGISRGLGDIIATVEWKPFVNGPHSLLVMGGMKFPTGDRLAIPLLGTGTFDIVFNISAAHYSNNWYAALNIDTLLTTKRKGFKPGSVYEYELVFGRAINFMNKGSSKLFINLDLTGIYEKQDKINGIIDENTGGNVIFFGPLISWTRKNLLFEVLFQGPIAQNLFGNQSKFNYTTFFSFTLIF